METEDREVPASEIFDRGRRGEPLLGCDCMKCFGYCMVDHDAARRDMVAGPVQHDGED